MGAIQPVGTLPRGAQTRARSLRDGVRERARTTPGRLVVLAIAILLGALCFGIVASLAVRSRSQAAHAAATQTEPLLVVAATLYSSLSAANATATTTFLRGGLEPAARRAQYLRQLRLATDSLATLTREVGAGDARAAVAAVGEQLPVYTGLVEAARADNRQGFPVGAAYLRQASGLLGSAILPQADRLYAIEAQRLSDDYQAGTSSTALIVLLVVAALALALLIGAQLYVTSISRRIFNVPLIAATVVLIGVSAWAAIGMVAEQNALARARRHSDSVEALTAARVLVARAQSDQSLTLVNRGSDETDPADFAAVIRRLAPNGGLLGEVSGAASQSTGKSDALRLTSGFRAYRAEAQRIAELENSGRIGDATDRASSAASTSIADRLNAELAVQTAVAQRRFSEAAADATSAVSGLWLGIPLLTLLATGLALLGLRQRLGEYR